VNAPEIIHWIDSCHHGSGWVDKDTISPSAAVCVSIGYVLHEDANFITLAAHLADTQVAGAMSIPKLAITYRMKIQFPAR